MENDDDKIVVKEAIEKVEINEDCQESWRSFDQPRFITKSGI